MRLKEFFFTNSNYTKRIFYRVPVHHCLIDWPFQASFAFFLINKNTGTGKLGQTTQERSYTILEMKNYNIDFEVLCFKISKEIQNFQWILHDGFHFCPISGDATVVYAMMRTLLLLWRWPLNEEIVYRWKFYLWVWPGWPGRYFKTTAATTISS